ncbi:deleted in malignant brain tumors 1 -like, partial [Paramuricea clavata]
MKLVNGRNSLEGRILVYFNGSWGTICDDGWDAKAASVACRELSLGSPVEPQIVNQARFESNDGYKDNLVWLSGVSCKGNENSLIRCDHE